ncbi:MAG: hypothetical protein JW917_02045 [Ignavibacteria bacterium]|nr:hypothetical protein [Ignavibacteria bacterium]
MKKLFALIFLLSINCSAYSQIENAPLSYPIYEFIKEMTVKKVIYGYDDGNSNLSRGEIIDYLREIRNNLNELSSTEKKLLSKYEIEFIPEKQNDENSLVIFDGKGKFINKIKEAFSDKFKQVYKFEKGDNNLYVNFIGNVFAGKELKPFIKHNAAVMDGGLRIRGTLFGHLGYYLSFSKGAIFGQGDIAQLIYPDLKYDFKFNENTEKLKNYDFTNAYLKYGLKPADNMDLTIQLGREKITYGLGYGSRLFLSGETPDMDFLKLNFKYGVLNYSYFHASTVGDFNIDRDKRYTKYFVANRLMIAIKDVLNFSLAESIIYNGRIDFAYLNPVLFYAFAEKSLQDRDNKNFSVDLQTKFLKNAEFSFSSLIDDDELFAFMSGKTDHTEKIGYQIGGFFYEPFGLKNLSLSLAYTKIRPYVYSHYDEKNAYTAYGVNLGHRIGPNTDEIYSSASYNISNWGRIEMEYRFIRKGNNVYDESGNLVKNVGGDISVPFRDGIDDDYAPFLDGVRVNSNVVDIGFRFQIIQNITFWLKYIYRIDNNITKNLKNDVSFAFFRMNVDY